jgi:hypothetical protein
MPVTPDMFDTKTPPEVHITAEAPPPIVDATLGITVQRPAGGTPRHRLVAIGDSLTHGFQSGAIYNTRLSYPMIIAWELGWDEHMRVPTYDGFGGLPLNIEYVVRDLEHRYGTVNWLELPLALFHARHLLDQIEDWWERGPGAHVPQHTSINHNLAVYGWDLRDTLDRTATICERAITTPKDQLFAQIVENANERAALRVLQSARDASGVALTPLQAAKALGDEGTAEDGTGDGIETLIVFLGANNALPTVVQLKVAWSQSPACKDLAAKNEFTVWNPLHFAEELALVATEVSNIKARHVIWLTVPHVTIAPIARGVGAKIRPESRYYPYYTRPWITDAQFDRTDDPHITGQEARAIDSAIDQYNQSIATVVHDARSAGKDWYVLDVAAILDRLAARRYRESPAARPAWWTPYELPADLAALQPVPDSRFFSSDRSGRTTGGLFALDGVHPTTIAYGILAQEVIRVMERAGVTFLMGDGQTVRQGPVNVDFRRLIAMDTLISHPPSSLESDLGWLARFDHLADTFRRLFRKGA